MAVRRLKRCNDKIQQDKFVSGIFNNNRNIFDEVRKMRGKDSKNSTRIDNEVGASNIANHFASSYNNLYNNVKNGEKLDSLRAELNRGVDKSCDVLLSRVNSSLVDQALKKLKPKKRDAVYDTVSDCYINGPDILAFHLSNLIRLFIVHGSVPQFILLCTLIPIVKDGLGDITSSDNYRAIAGGCLLLKLLDMIILLLEGDKLKFSELQFAYQAMSSTSVCTWSATAVIDHFNRNGTAVYCAAMDMSKAFNMIEWVPLYRIDETQS